MALLIGISLGDVSGIGPEVTLKALALELPADDARYFLIGDEQHVRALNKQLGLNLDLASVPLDTRHLSLTSSSRRVFVANPGSAGVSPASSFSSPAAGETSALPGSPVAARAAVAWLKEGAQRSLRHELDGLVTAPANKESIVRSVQPFIAQTEFLSHLAGAQRTAMMLLGHDERDRSLRAAPATTHLPL